MPGRFVMKEKMKAVFLGLLTFFVTQSLLANSFKEQAVSWAHKYSYDNGSGVTEFSPIVTIQTRDGGFLVSDGASLLKLNALGEATWQRSYNCRCTISVVVESSKNGYLVASTTDFLDESYVTLLRVDTNGNLIWSKRYRRNRFDSTQSLIGTRDGGYLLGAFSASVASKKDGKAWLIKLGGSGAIQWQKTYNVARPNSIHQLINGDFLVGTEQFSVLRLTRSGNVRSQRKFLGDGCCSQGIMRAIGEKGFIFAGNRVDNSIYSVVLISVDSTGSILFSKTYNKQRLKDIRPTSDGGYILLSTRESFPAPQRISITKLDANGNVTWRRLSKVKDLIFPFNILQASDGGFLITSLDNFILKIDQSGNIPDICRNVLTSAATTVGNIIINQENRSPTVSITHAVPETETFDSSNVIPIVESICSP